MKAMLLGGMLLLAACEEPAAPAKVPVREQEPPATRPTVPPRAVQATEAFYIASVPNAATRASVAVCHSDADCNQLLPPDPPNIVRRFTEEAWIVIEVPAGHDAKNVISDGTTAVARVEPATGTEAKVVLYRVAPTVVHAVLSVP